MATASSGEQAKIIWLKFHNILYNLRLNIPNYNLRLNIPNFPVKAINQLLLFELTFAFCLVEKSFYL